MRFLISLTIISAVISSCGQASPTQISQPATSAPTNMPTATEDPFAHWNTFTDPSGVLSFRYPQGWTAREASSSDVGEPSFIASFDLLIQFESSAGELSIPEGEFLLAVGLESDEVPDDVSLSDWTMEQASPTVDVQSTQPVQVDGRESVIVIGILPSGVPAASLFIPTDAGIYFVQGEPYEDGRSEQFDMIISTIQIN